MALVYVPNPGQTLHATRDTIRTNFENIDTGFNIDHSPLVLANQGKHNKITFPVQAGAPVFLAGEEGLYSLAMAGTNELYIHKQYHAGTQNIPLTNSTISTVARATGELAYTYLPSGIILQWGTWNTAASTFLVSLPIAFPHALLNVQLTPHMPGPPIPTNMFINWMPVVPPLPTQQFQVGITVNGASQDGTFSFLAIGY